MVCIGHQMQKDLKRCSVHTSASKISFLRALIDFDFSKDLIDYSSFQFHCFKKGDGIQIDGPRTTCAACKQNQESILRTKIDLFFNIEKLLRKLNLLFWKCVELNEI